MTYTPIVQPTCPNCAGTLGPAEGCHRYCGGCDVLIYEDRFVWPDDNDEPETAHLEAPAEPVAGDDELPNDRVTVDDDAIERGELAF